VPCLVILVTVEYLWWTRLKFWKHPGKNFRFSYRRSRYIGFWTQSSWYLPKHWSCVDKQDIARNFFKLSFQWAFHEVHFFTFETFEKKAKFLIFWKRLLAISVHLEKNRRHSYVLGFQSNFKLELAGRNAANHRYQKSHLPLFLRKTILGAKMAFLESLESDVSNFYQNRWQWQILECNIRMNAKSTKKSWNFHKFLNRLSNLRLFVNFLFWIAITSFLTNLFEICRMW